MPAAERNFFWKSMFSRKRRLESAFPFQKCDQFSGSRSLAGASNVEHAPIGIEHRLLHHLGERRVREYGVDELLLRGLEVHRHDIALDQLGYLGADHVRAEHRPGVLVEDHLDETLVLAQRDRLAVADEWKAADADIEL